MPDFDNAIAKTIAAQRRVTEAAKAASEAITAEREAEGAERPIVLPDVAPLPPKES